MVESSGKPGSPHPGLQVYVPVFSCSLLQAVSSANRNPLGLLVGLASNWCLRSHPLSTGNRNQSVPGPLSFRYTILGGIQHTSQASWVVAGGPAPCSQQQWCGSTNIALYPTLPFPVSFSPSPPFYFLVGLTFERIASLQAPESKAWTRGPAFLQSGKKGTVQGERSPGASSEAGSVSWGCARAWQPECQAKPCSNRQRNKAFPLSPSNQLLHSSLWMSFAEGLMSRAFVVRSWGQRLKFALSAAFILWIQQRLIKKNLPVVCSVLIREMSLGAGGQAMSSSQPSGPSSFLSQLHPAHLIPQPNSLKEQSKAHCPFFKRDP